MDKKCIGVLTSGGDAPGMNAAIRAVVRAAASYGLETKGVIRGYNGLIDDNIVDLNIRSVSDIIHHGGTMLGTARSPRFKTEEGMQQAIEVCKKHNISGLVVIGGDGSFRGARDLSERGIPCIGVPCTIDNDIACSDYTIGYDTACNTAIDMVDRLRDTMMSHSRCSVVEIMGNKAGYLTLSTAIAVGATAIIVPELPYDFYHDIIDKINLAKKSGKRHFIIAVAEGIGRVEELAHDIQRETGIETRATILGHVQRGGAPDAKDRIVSAKMGYLAVQLLAQGIGNRVVAVKDDKIVDYDIFEALNMKKQFDLNEYNMALRISL